MFDPLALCVTAVLSLLIYTRVREAEMAAPFVFQDTSTKPCTRTSHQPGARLPQAVCKNRCNVDFSSGTRRLYGRSVRKQTLDCASLPRNALHISVLHKVLRQRDLRGVHFSCAWRQFLNVPLASSRSRKIHETGFDWTSSLTAVRLSRWGSTCPWYDVCIRGEHIQNCARGKDFVLCLASPRATC